MCPRVTTVADLKSPVPYLLTLFLGHDVIGTDPDDEDAHHWFSVEDTEEPPDGQALPAEVMPPISGTISYDVCGPDDQRVIFAEIDNGKLFDLWIDMYARNGSLYKSRSIKQTADYEATTETKWDDFGAKHFVEWIVTYSLRHGGRYKRIRVLRIITDLKAGDSSTETWTPDDPDAGDLWFLEDVLPALDDQPADSVPTTESPLPRQQRGTDALPISSAEEFAMSPDDQRSPGQHDITGEYDKLGWPDDTAGNDATADYETGLDKAMDVVPSVPDRSYAPAFGINDIKWGKSALLSYAMLCTAVGTCFVTMRMLKGKEVDPRITIGPDWDAARAKENKSFVDFDVYDSIRESSMPKGTKPVPTRWVYTIKDDGTKKARLTARGDIETRRFGEQMNVDAPTASRQSARIFFHVTTEFEWEVIGWDVPTAFLQQDTDYMDNRKVSLYLRPPIELRTYDDEIWACKKVPYGMADAPRAWYLTIRKFLEADGFVRIKGEPCSFVKRKGTVLIGQVLLHVDDGIMSGTPEFLAAMKLHLTSKYKIKEYKTGDFVNCGIRIRRETYGYSLSQADYCDLLDEPPIDPKRPDDSPLTAADIKVIQCVTGAVNWLSTQTRPDLSFDTSALAGDSGPTGTYGALKKACKLIRKARHAKDVKVTFRKLHGPLCLRVWTDAAFANMPGSRSQSGNVIVITAATCPGTMVMGNLLSYQSHRIKRVCRSTFTGETLATVSAVDDGQYLQSVLEDWLSMTIPMELRTDCASLAEHLAKLDSAPMEKRLKIDLDGLREDVSAGRYSVVWCDTRIMVADPLTKQMDAAPLRLSMSTGDWPIAYDGPNKKDYSGASSRTSPTEAALAILSDQMPSQFLPTEGSWQEPWDDWSDDFEMALAANHTSRGVLIDLPVVSWCDALHSLVCPPKRQGPL